MKTKLLSLAIAATALASQMAFASDGTITFNGNVSATTCSIASSSGSTTGTQTFTVQLPSVSANTLSTAASTAGTTPFTITLSGCTGNVGTGNVHTFFENSGITVDPTTGNLKVDAGGATNVQIRLLNAADNSQILVNQPDGSQNSTPASLTGAGPVSLTYKAQYISPTGGATAGAANSSVQYTIVYP